MEVRLKITDSNGKAMVNKMVAGEQQINLRLDSLFKPGTYMLVIDDEGKNPEKSLQQNCELFFPSTGSFLKRDFH